MSESWYYYRYPFPTFLSISDEREISPTHKFYASLQDGQPEDEEEEEVNKRQQAVHLHRILFFLHC